MSGSEDVEMMDAEVQFDHMGPSSTDGPASPSSTGATAGTSDGYESPASPSSNATTTGTSDDDYELPIPIAACLRVMSGRLAMGEDFYLLIPDAGFTLSRFRGHPAHPPRVLSKAKTPEQLEEARRFLYSKHFLKQAFLNAKTILQLLISNVSDCLLIRRHCERDSEVLVQRLQLEVRRRPSSETEFAERHRAACFPERR
jgi:hypothetical protein